ncbi:MAG: hypothetical protein JNN07_12475 [Verrucomicrobiales bacterium]|nr:hypothetical protein [Verrucomicrobiales bacterium]
MNPSFNAYPKGRWITPKPSMQPAAASGHHASLCQLVPSQPIEPAEASLSELFWNEPGFALSEEARARIEQALEAVLKREVAVSVAPSEPLVA